MEFDEIVVKESPGLCRCCLSEGCYKDMGTEYAWMNENEVYADMLFECFDISISQLNDGPNGPNRLICEVCITRLRDACYFKKQVLESEKKFVDMVGRGEFKPKGMIVYESNMKAEKAEDIEVSFDADETEVEYLEDEMDYVDDEDLKTEEPSTSVSDVTAEALPVRSKRGRPRKAPAKPVKKVKAEPKAKSSKALVKGKRRKMSLGRHTRDALRLRRLRETRLLEQRVKHLRMSVEKQKETVAQKQQKVKSKVAKNKGKVKKNESAKPAKKSRTKQPPPLSKAEKTAYQFAKPIVKVPSTPKCYNRIIQQHLSLSNVGIDTTNDAETVDNSDSSRENILHHMKLVMGRVRLGKNSRDGLHRDAGGT